jgi:uncharacterized protein (TIGR03790 family)
MLKRIFGVLTICLLPLSAYGAAEIFLPVSKLQASQLAVIINDADLNSAAIGNYYRQRRNIPAANIIHVRFDPGKKILHPGEFAVIKKQVDALTPEHIQAYALTWVEPYRVGCMSITAAFAFGYNERFCAKGCLTTQPSEYAGSSSLKPYDDYGIRPTMIVAGESLAQGKALIDRGIAADGSWPEGAAYLVTTSDAARSVRKVRFPHVAQQFSRYLPIHQLTTETISGKKDVMFYFTGATRVKDLAENHYLPGAMADHLTSAGGKLTDSRQMSVLRWLEAGATGTYGAVVEPCNLLQKFPDPLVAMSNYLKGASLIEAYWKSVLMPGQGVFVGEPLASPYAAYRVIQHRNLQQVQSPQLTPGYYSIFASDRRYTGYRLLVSGVPVLPGSRAIGIGKGDRAYYRIEREE